MSLPVYSTEYDEEVFHQGSFP